MKHRFISTRLFLLATGALLGAVTLVPRAARAHFILTQPPSFQAQDIVGDPQKAGPCGGAGTSTGVVTPYRAGDVVHFVFKETVAHGGHYRIALGLTGQADIPADPPVTAPGGISMSAPIQDPPQFPVLADGVHPHDGAPPAEWTYDVRLPANVTCANCLLQITQFMTDHGSNTGQNDGFFYHHCAAISIAPAAAADGGAPAADAAPVADAGAPAADAARVADASADARGDARPSSSGGSGGCSIAGPAGGAPGLLLLGLAAAWLGRRRRARMTDAPWLTE